jgi:hypothetical protein
MPMRSPVRRRRSARVSSASAGACGRRRSSVPRAPLGRVAVERLEELGLLSTRGDVEALAALEEALDALEVLQGWVEERLSRVAA